jgi:hypothetical protein
MGRTTVAAVGSADPDDAPFPPGSGGIGCFTPGS